MLRRLAEGIEMRRAMRAVGDKDVRTSGEELNSIHVILRLEIFFVRVTDRTFSSVELLSCAAFIFNFQQLRV